MSNFDVGVEIFNKDRFVQLVGVPTREFYTTGCILSLFFLSKIKKNVLRKVVKHFVRRLLVD